MEKFKRYATNDVCVGHTYGISNPFILPKNMTLEEANKVVSYLTEKIEKENNLLQCSERSVSMISGLLEDYGFQEVKNSGAGHMHAITLFEPFRRIRAANARCAEMSNVADLFTVSGDVRLFENSELNRRYFDWYTPDVTEDEVNRIYERINFSSSNNSQDDAENEIV